MGAGTMAPKTLRIFFSNKVAPPCLGPGSYPSFGQFSLPPLGCFPYAFVLRRKGEVRNACLPQKTVTWELLSLLSLLLLQIPPGSGGNPGPDLPERRHVLPLLLRHTAGPAGRGLPAGLPARAAHEAVPAHPPRGSFLCEPHAAQKPQQQREQTSRK